MRIDGKAIRESIIENLHKEISTLGVIPHLAIILVGNNPSSVAYVRQKELRAKEIGVETTIKKMPSNTTQTKLLSTIEQFNNNSNIHGLIVQQPLPKQINEKDIVEAVKPEKDIDGLHSNSPFPMPLAEAVMEILKQIFIRLHLVQGVTFEQWLRTKKIVVLGKGDTGGGPVITRLRKDNIKVDVIDSKTKNPQELIKQADIVISAVGKRNLITPDKIKQGVILISIGLFKGEDGKLHGDYDGDKIQDIASFYTPVPGGVGPVNVAMLLKNLVKATNWH